MRSNTSGKVEQVTHTNRDKVQYLYDAAGNRVAKLHTQGTTTSTTQYVRDASGNTMTVYKNDALAEVPIYGSSRLGMYTGANTSNSRTLGNKSYELTNHLGNVMAVVTDDFTITTDSVTNTKEAEVIRSTDYYPFGLEQPGTRATSHTTGSSAYRYGFNGKEKDDKGEFGSTVYDYGFRIYNPQIAKFLSVDPLANDYPYYSSYQYAGNTPTVFIDLDGLEPFKSELSWKREPQLENRLGNPRNEQYFSNSGFDGNGNYSDHVIAKKVMSENGSKYYWLNKTDHLWQEFDGGNVRPEDVERVAVTAIAVTGAGISGAVLMESGGAFLVREGLKRYFVSNSKQLVEGGIKFGVDAFNQYLVTGDFDKIDWANALASGLITNSYLKNAVSSVVDYNLENGLDDNKGISAMVTEFMIRSGTDEAFSKLPKAGTESPEIQKRTQQIFLDLVKKYTRKITKETIFNGDTNSAGTPEN